MPSKTAAMEFIAEQTGDVFVRVSPRGIVRHVSGSVRWLGLEPEALVGTSGLELVHPDDRAAFLANTASAIRGERLMSADRVHRFRTGDGRWVWMEGNPRVVKNRRGRIVELVNVFRDVTERREAALALAESERRYRLLAENASDVIACFDADARFTYLSPAIEPLLGYRPEELLGRRTRDVMHPEDYAASLTTYRAHLAGPTPAAPFRFEYRALRKDGGVVWVEGRPRAVFDDGGRLTGFHDVVRDMTAERAAEAARAESERRFRLLAENASDVILESRPDGTLTYVSPASLALTGWAPDEVIGKTAQAWVHPDDWPRIVAAFREQVTSGGTAARQVLEYRLLTRDGREIWLESSPRANVDPATGRVVSVTDSGRDVTAHKALEARLAEARDAAEAAARVKGEFMANMSHEIRTPLTAILGFASLLGARDDLAAQARDQLSRISGAGQALLAIVNDILDFSAVEAGQVTLKPRPAALGETIAESLALFEPQATGKGIALLLEGCGGLPHALVDPDRLRQVLLNLIGNAVKFTDAGSVSVRAAYDAAGERLSVRITDSGPGLDAAQQAVLFQRFSQVDASTTRRHGGTGLGLAICKGLVDAMGGAVGVESAPGAGSTFWFDVPAPIAEAVPEAADAELAAGLDGLRILVADDNPINRELVRALLKPFAVELSEAVDGEEAVELALSNLFDLVLMDIRMPRCDGPDAVLRIRNQSGPNQHIPILAFTADFDLKRYGEQAAAGFDGVVAKPINGPDMIAAIARHTSFADDAWGDEAAA